MRVFGNYFDGGAMQTCFKIGDKAVHPAHGVGVIKGIESRNIAGSRQDFYLIKIMASGATVMVPIDGTSKAGMRALTSGTDIDGVRRILETPGKVSQTTWNRRFRGFNDKLRTGCLNDVAEVFRDLWCLKADKELSFQEKKMLDKARYFLVNEVSASTGRPRTDIEVELQTWVGHP